MRDREVSRGTAATSRSNELNFSGIEVLMTYWLRRASRKLTQALDAERLDVKPYDFAALSLIVGNPGVTSAQLSDALGISRPNFVLMLRDLEGAGLVFRCLHADDGRASALHATAAGKEKVSHLAPLLRELEAESLGLLGPRESALLLQLLQKLCNERECARPQLAGVESGCDLEG